MTLEVGKKIGHWTLKEFKREPASLNSLRKWFCQCDCGTSKWVNETRLKNGESQSCGCMRNEAKPSTLSVGSKRGKWTLVEFSPSHKEDGVRIHSRWRCKCECGNVRWVSDNHLKAGRSKSCGCDRAAQHKREMSLAFGAGNLKRRPLV